MNVLAELEKLQKAAMRDPVLRSSSCSRAGKLQSR